MNKLVNKFLSDYVKVEQEHGGVVCISGKSKTCKTKIGLSLALSKAIEDDENLTIVNCELDFKFMLKMVRNFLDAINHSDYIERVTIMQLPYSINDSVLDSLITDLSKDTVSGVIYIDNPVYAGDQALNKFMCSLSYVGKVKKSCIFVSGELSDLVLPLLIKSGIKVFKVNRGVLDNNIFTSKMSLLNSGIHDDIDVSINTESGVGTIGGAILGD